MFKKKKYAIIKEAISKDMATFIYNYFLKCSDKTSYPIFHEPRTGARATKLKMKPGNGVFHGTELVHFKPKPGTLIIFPGYLEHEYAVDFGVEPFRFIHWNIQAVPKEMAKDVV